MATRGSSGRSCVLAVRKPSGMSSHDVVNRCRSAFAEKRVGHFGTLDPLAEGVMLVGVGPAARLNASLVEHDKCYVARVVFGQFRNTDDAEGEVIGGGVCGPDLLDEEFARTTLAGFVGTQMQMPPQFSAIKRGGVTAYEAARKGESIELDAREITVFAADLVSLEGECGNPDNPPVWNVRFAVSKGTYIRSLARDLGARTGAGAYLGGLMRETLGDIGLEDCASLDALAEAKLLDPVALLDFPVVTPDAAMLSRLENGNALSAPAEASAWEDGAPVSIADKDTLFAVYRYNKMRNRLDCDCKFSVGVERG